MEVCVIYIECPGSLVQAPLKKLFLAGGISGCRHWQEEVAAHLTPLDIIVLNPRRKFFDTTDKKMEQYQIKWEFKMLTKSDIVSFYFCRETVCPITLYELGRSAALGKKLIVGMDEDYSRRRDVEIQLSLARPELKIVYGLDNFINAITRRFKFCRENV